MPVTIILLAQIALILALKDVSVHGHPAEREDKILELEKQVSALSEQMKVLMETKFQSARDFNVIGFTAVHNHGPHMIYSVGARIPYNQVSTNDGGAYDLSTGTFTCPVSGYYYFSFSVIQAEEQTVSAALKVNTVVMASVTSIGGDGNSATAGAVSRCDATQQVWVEVTVSGHIHGGPYSTFTGFLVQLI